MPQRRIDLAVLEDHELRSMMHRFQAMRRIARELGAVDTVQEQWEAHVAEIEEELEIRRREGTDTPF